MSKIIHDWAIVFAIAEATVRLARSEYDERVFLMGVG